MGLGRLNGAACRPLHQDPPPPAARAAADGTPPTASFERLPAAQTLTMGMHVPEPWYAATEWPWIPAGWTAPVAATPSSHFGVADKSLGVSSSAVPPNTPSEPALAHLCIQPPLLHPQTPPPPPPKTPCIRLVEPVLAEHDLDNIRLDGLAAGETLQATFELESLLITGSAVDLAALELHNPTAKEARVAGRGGEGDDAWSHVCGQAAARCKQGSWADC